MRCGPHVLKMDATPFEFSPNGDLAIHSSHDGVLKVWETATNNVKSEYKPSSHLSASCSCLSWCQKVATSEKPKKKKRRSSGGGNVAAAVTELNLVAVGTISGSILMYSVSKGDLHSQLVDGHADRVNGICWYTEQNLLYSCSSDHHICEWEITTSKLKNKWKADKGTVHSVCKCSNKHLLSAGRSIKLWDLTTKQVLKVFTGHTTEVFRLLHIPLNVEDAQSVENSYFLSAAVNDRHVHAWQINTSSSDKNALASFSLPDEPVAMHVTSQDKQTPICLVVVTKCGKALIYNHTLNGKLKKPLKPKCVIQIASEVARDEVPRPIQILSAHVCREDGHQMMLVHGNLLKPTFEKVMYSTAEPEICLVRQDPMRMVVRKDTSVTKVKTPMVSKDLNVLVPSHMAPSQPTQEAGARRKRKVSVGEMAMEDRLNAISLNGGMGAASGGAEGKQPPKADSLVTMLMQGLQSQDKAILDNVLQNTDHTLIKKTVQKLPLQMIIPLVQELTKRMFGHAQSGIVTVRWVKTVLAVHTSYLMTFPQIIDTFSSLYQMMDSRVNMFGRLSKLQGRLDIMLSQISIQTQEEPVASQQPLLQFEEESSDEDLEELGMFSGAYDSEQENWEDISDEDSDMEAEDEVNSKG